MNNDGTEWELEARKRPYALPSYESRLGAQLAAEIEAIDGYDADRVRYFRIRIEEIYGLPAGMKESIEWVLDRPAPERCPSCHRTGGQCSH